MPFLDGERKIIIGESATRLREGEPLTHPHFFDLLEEIRRRHPAAPLQVTTNGSLLDREKIRRLAALAPLEVVLSLNSSSSRGRRLLMSDPAPEAVLAGIERLAVHGIPFHGSIVALPHLVGWPDCSGLLTVADYRQAVQPALKKGCPRRILVPAVSFDTCGLDMAGSHYGCLQEVTSLPVEVVR